MIYNGNDKIYIILLNYNGFELTRECINSLKGMYNQNYEIIVVDNASTDGSYDLLYTEYGADKKIVILKNERNNGFADGNNFGIRYAIKNGGKLFLLLNNDTEVEKDFLDKIVSNYNYDSIHTPKINFFNDKNDIWYAAGEIDYGKCIVKNGNADIEKKVSFATGCCMLFSKNIVDKIGLMNEEYFMYYEDVDYSLKAINNGVDIIYKPGALVYHKVGKSSGGEKSILSIYYNNRNRFYIMKKYHFGIKCKIYTFVTRTIRLVVAKFKNNNDKIIIEAYRDYKKGIIGKKNFDILGDRG